MARGRLWAVGAAVAFARSERGQKLIADARRKYDTPANRAKLHDAVTKLRDSRSASGGSSRSR